MTDSGMKVGVNTLFLIPGEVGGSETYMRGTLGALCEQHPEIELVLFTNRENDISLRELFGAHSQVGFSKLDFRASNRYARIVREQVELPLKVRRAGVDLLWSPGYTAPLLCRCPLVTSILDMQYKTHPEDLTRVAWWTTAVLVALGSRRSRAITTLSEFSKSEIVRHTGVPAERVHVTHLAADPAFGRRLPEQELARRLTTLLGGRGPYLLVVSNTYPHKNVYLAVEAFGSILADIPHQLVLLGRPRLGEPAVAKAVAAIDSSRVRRLEYVVREDLVALYQGADLLVFPSLYEGFGLPVLEAMLAGVPVVTTRKGSIPEIAGDFAAYFDETSASDLAQQIQRVLTWGGEERSGWVSRAADHARAFTWRKTAFALADALKSAVETGV